MVVPETSVCVSGVALLGVPNASSLFKLTAVFEDTKLNKLSVAFTVTWNGKPAVKGAAGALPLPAGSPEKPKFAGLPGRYVSPCTKAINFDAAPATIGILLTVAVE